jgi:hypothetical protein
MDHVNVGTRCQDQIANFNLDNYMQITGQCTNGATCG